MFILELDKVSTLTQARFAAGEGFTHVCFDLADMESRQFNFQAIRDFLSGVKIGIWADEQDRLDLNEVDYIKERIDGKTVIAAPTQPGDGDSDFVVVDGLPENYTKMKCVLSVQDAGLGDTEAVTRNLDDLCGISLQAPPEERTGFLTISDDLRDFLDMLEDRNLKIL